MSDLCKLLAIDWIKTTILHSPVDLVYTGWVDKDRTHLNLSSWAEELAEWIVIEGENCGDSI